MLDQHDNQDGDDDRDRDDDCDGRCYMTDTAIEYDAIIK